jgi:hypothetical protein
MAPFLLSPARGILLCSACGSGARGRGSEGEGDRRRRFSALLDSVGARPLSFLGHLTLTLNELNYKQLVGAHEHEFEEYVAQQMFVRIPRGETMNNSLMSTLPNILIMFSPLIK